MLTNQGTDDGHQADTEEDTSGSSVAGEDDAADNSSDSDDRMSSQMTEFLEEKRLNKKSIRSRSMNGSMEHYVDAQPECAGGLCVAKAIHTDNMVTETDTTSANDRIF